MMLEGTVARFLLFVSLFLFSSGCRLVGASSSPTARIAYVVVTSTPTVTATATATAIPTVTPSATPTATPIPTATAPSTATPTATATATPRATPTYTPYCAEPPELYGRVVVRGHDLNARTLAMLETAGEMYEGPADLLRISQGSYRDTLAISFGTHTGGGAVDISIRHPQDGTILYGETEAMVQVLRAAGFAAWYRRAGDLGPGSADHLHAIAIGDRELSAAAQKQIQSYFAGMDGLIDPWGPNPDSHGGPIICPWMEVLLGE